MFLSSKARIITIVTAIGLALIAIFRFGFYTPAVSAPATVESVQTSNEPQIISTDPSPLEGAVLLAAQPIRITFNVELENGPETKATFDPVLEMKADISGDRKTLILTPKTSYPAGQGFTLTIHKDAKLANGKTLGFEKEYHFRTISYSGI